MKILLASYAFRPSVGGLEELTALLADAFMDRGHVVKVVTMTPSAQPDIDRFKVLRRPKPQDLIDEIRWCDVFLQENVGFRLGWPNFLIRRPWVIALQGNLDRDEGRDGAFAWKSRIKHSSLRLATQIIAASAAVARRSFPAAVVIGNPYRRAIFRCIPETVRRFDLVFLGRLVSDKGASILLDAMALLARRNLRPSLLVIGAGPEEQALRKQCDGHGLTKQITFAGLQGGEALVQLLNQCRIMVVPSIWEEPFGIVALEGIACGCAVVAAQSGGLPEAVGPCGTTFAKGDPGALAAVLETLLPDRARIASYLECAPAHLAKHAPEAVADAYLGVLAAASSRQR